MAAYRTAQAIWAVVPARMGSERFPGKTLAPLSGTPSLRHIVTRLEAVPSLDGVIVATTAAPRDDVICECAREAGIPAYRGSENDVMARMLEAAQSVRADTIIRVTGDCPLVDPQIVEATITKYVQLTPDYACNFLSGHQYPRGMEVEAFPVELLASLERETNAPRDREHVTPMFYEHPDRFRLAGVDPSRSQCRAGLRLTLDTPEDYELISAIYDALYPRNPLFGLTQVLAFLERRPELETLNASAKQKSP
jgi:spore coat polysaccharide biosynthesis protein SpsF